MTRTVSRTVVIDAPADQIFTLLADPRRHADFDGSGTVRSQLKAPDTLSLGARFGMKMKMGVPYTITNEVVEFEPGRVIAWRHLGKHVWRYELEPSGTGTQVTETFDWSTSRAPKALELLSYPKKNAVSIEKTLQRLKKLAEGA
jgi:uncharacterized protein YndB with AHSA1/START domain